MPGPVEPGPAMQMIERKVQQLTAQRNEAWKREFELAEISATERLALLRAEAPQRRQLARRWQHVPQAGTGRRVGVLLARGGGARSRSHQVVIDAWGHSGL